MTQPATGPSTSDPATTGAGAVKTKSYMYGAGAQRTLPRRAAASK